VRRVLLLLALILAAPAAAQLIVQARGWPQVNEAEDFGVPASAELRVEDHADVTGDLRRTSRGHSPLERYFFLRGRDRSLSPIPY
jgi:hypothetical protein